MEDSWAARAEETIELEIGVRGLRFSSGVRAPFGVWKLKCGEEAAILDVCLVLIALATPQPHGVAVHQGGTSGQCGEEGCEMNSHAIDGKTPHCPDE